LSSKKIKNFVFFGYYEVILLFKGFTSSLMGSFWDMRIYYKYLFYNWVIKIIKLFIPFADLHYSCFSPGTSRFSFEGNNIIKKGVYEPYILLDRESM
jgi:hypothetical protein